MIFRETFFRPDEIGRETWTMPAELYNRSHHLLNRTQGKCVFVPIRSMQYLGVIDREEIIFIDGTGGYMYQNHEGGRIIQLAWQNFNPQVRESLTSPVPCHIVYYLPAAKEAMKRLIREFADAVQQLEQRQQVNSHQSARILPWRRETD
jgi:hypothetical protein